MSAPRALCAFTLILALAVAPAALGQGNSGAKKPPAGSPDAMYTVPSPQGKAYGYYCKGVSKKKVRGQKGTPFSQCVKAMKALDTGKAKSPAKACKALSKKKPAKVKGANRRGKSPYAKCVSGAKRLLKDKQPA